MRYQILKVANSRVSVNKNKIFGFLLFTHTKNTLFCFTDLRPLHPRGMSGVFVKEVSSISGVKVFNADKSLYNF